VHEPRAGHLGFGYSERRQFADLKKLAALAVADMANVPVP
jgi:hypothetical protein